MKKNTLKDQLKSFEPMIEAIVEVFHPFVEAAVHDLEKGTIAALYHNISQRKVGDKSPLKELKIELNQFPDKFDPYYKRNWDGRPLKCTSITLRNEKGQPIGLVCFNVDTTVFQEVQKTFDLFLQTKPKAENPVEIHGTSFEEQCEEMINGYLTEKNLSANHLNRDQKKQLVQHLYSKGLFNFKNAPPYVAQLLKISRATVYNHIKEIGEP